ncbi:MAG: dockerin type I repeat-containing protein [Prevotella sp.]|nr:dockerin type I repeat-containing protein [Prevotella sp.]
MNGDGTVSVADVTLLVNIIIGNEDETSIQNADINGDGTISIADVTALTDIILNESINIMNVVVYGAEGIRFE